MSDETSNMTAKTLEELESLISEIRDLDSDPMQVKVIQYYLFQIGKLFLIAVAASATLATFHFGWVDFGHYWKYTPLVLAGGVLYYLIVVVGREHFERSNFDKNRHMIGYWVKELVRVDKENAQAKERISQLEKDLSDNPPEKAAAQQAKIKELSDAWTAPGLPEADLS